MAAEEIKKSFYDKTDNTFLPNTEQGWKDLHWWMHFLGGRCLVMAWHLANKETRHLAEVRKNIK